MAALVPHGTHEGLVTIPQELGNGHGVDCSNTKP